jgi:hypothetical protein
VIEIYLIIGIWYLMIKEKIGKEGVKNGLFIDRRTGNDTGYCKADCRGKNQTGRSKV